jgi:hypothetical protein
MSTIAKKFLSTSLKASAHFSWGIGFGGVVVDALMMHHPSSFLCTFWMVVKARVGLMVEVC